MSDQSWFSKGTGEAKKAREQMQSQYKPEFWLKDDNETAKVIVLDREPFNVHVHSVKVRGKFKKYTCLRKNCPLCVVNEPRLVSVYRIIDTRSYTDKNGKVHKMVERYWEIGSKLMTQVEMLAEDDSFYGKVIKVQRKGVGNKTSYGVTYSRDPERVPKPTLKTLEDYKPKSREELRTLAELLGARPDDDEDDAGGGSGKSTASRYYEEDPGDDEPPARTAGKRTFAKKTSKKPVDDLDEGEGDEDETESDVEYGEDESEVPY